MSAPMQAPTHFRWQQVGLLSIKRKYSLTENDLERIKSPLGGARILNPFPPDIGVTYYYGTYESDWAPGYGERKTFAKVPASSGRDAVWYELIGVVKKKTAGGARFADDSEAAISRDEDLEYASGATGVPTPWFLRWGKYIALAGLGGAATYVIMRDSEHRAAFAAGGATLAAGSVYLLGPGGPLRPGA